MKRIFFAGFLLLSFYVNAQNEGVQWATGYNWQQIKEKAKTENKYILIDAYTTWCKPCREMDKYVFSNDTVGIFINPRFIAVKVQMDKTSKDDQETMQWYPVAEELANSYYINSYPSYIFLSPSGEIVHKVSGFKEIPRFLDEAAEALRPGKKYDNPYALFEQQRADYLRGIKNYSTMPHLCKEALKAGDGDLANKVMKEYAEYLFSGKEEALYTKENIDFFTSTYGVIPRKSRVFKLFYPNGRKVDQVMGTPGFAAEVVDQSIYAEFVRPHVGKYTGALMTKVTPTDLKIPDWKEITKAVRKEYNSPTAKRAILSAQIDFYKRTAMFDKWVATYFKYVDKYGIDTIGNNAFANLNHDGWIIFVKIEDRKYLKKACEFMEIAANRYPLLRNTTIADTYACLLYKYGRIEEAIKWMEKIVSVLDKYPRQQAGFASTLAKMRKGEAIWVGQSVF